MISDLNLALDLNLSGTRKGCGVYPDPSILKRAWQLRIPLAIGSDCHNLEELGRDYAVGLELARQVGNVRTANTTVVGATAALMPVSVDSWQQAVAEVVPPGTAQINWQAFELGRDVTLNREAGSK